MITANTAGSNHTPRSLTINDIQLQTHSAGNLLKARQHYVQFFFNDTPKSTSVAKESKNRTTWGDNFSFEGDDNSVLLVNVYRKYCIRKDAQVGIFSGTLGEALAESNDGVFEVALRKDTSANSDLVGITIKFSLVAEPRGVVDADQRQAMDTIVKTEEAVSPLSVTPAAVEGLGPAVDAGARVTMEATRMDRMEEEVSALGVTPVAAEDLGSAVNTGTKVVMEATRMDRTEGEVSALSVTPVAVEGSGSAVITGTKVVMKATRIVKTEETVSRLIVTPAAVVGTGSAVDAGAKATMEAARMDRTEKVISPLSFTSVAVESISSADDTGTKVVMEATRTDRMYSTGREETGRSVERQNEATVIAQSSAAQVSYPMIPVDWPVGDKTWKTTSEEVQKRGIVQYRLYDNGFGIWDYKLEIINTENNDFLFWDETGDHYGINAFRTGEHSVQYNSDRPNIKFFQST